MHEKLLYFDTETTGTVPELHDPHQIACIIEIDNKVMAEEVFYAQPTNWDNVLKEALDVSGTCNETLQKYPPARQSYIRFKRLLTKYVDPYNSQDKFIAVGQNVRFDMNMLCMWFKKHNDNYFYSLVNSRDERDTLQLTKTLKMLGLMQGMENNKLSTICSHLKISITNAHNALCDIQATREVYKRYEKVMKLLAKACFDGELCMDVEKALLGKDQT